MKKFYTLLIALLAINSAMAQGCLPEGIIFLYQEEIDNFQTDYPGCTEIEGDVLIYFGVSNLNGLSVLTSIGGNLTIKSTGSLVNLNGLNNLTYVGGDLNIGELSQPNYYLSSLSGLENLTSIGGDLHIIYNEILPDLTGLEGLTSISGGLDISKNDSLVNLHGLENLSYLGGWLTAFFNESLINLDGLNSLTSIPGSLYISYNDILINLSGLENITSIDGGIIIGAYDLSLGNPSLLSLDALNNLTSVAGNIQIISNNSLSSLNGLGNIDYVGGNIEIFDNASLSYCEVKSICDYLSNPTGQIWLGPNAPGCNSKEEVEYACLAGIENIIQENNLSIYPNPSSSRFTIQFNLENEEQVKLLVLNNLGQVVATLTNERLSAGDHELNWNAEGMPAGVYFYNIQIGNQAGTGKMVLMK